MSPSVERDRAFIQGDPYEWPQYPLLPLKPRRMTDDFKEWGFILAGDQSKPVVYLSLIGFISGVVRQIQEETGKTEVTWGQIVQNFPKREFVDLEELLSVYTVD